MVEGLLVMIIKFGTLEVKSMSEADVCFGTEGSQGASAFFSLRCFKKTPAPYEGFWPRFASFCGRKRHAGSPTTRISVFGCARLQRMLGTRAVNGSLKYCASDYNLFLKCLFIQGSVTSVSWC